MNAGSPQNSPGRVILVNEPTPQIEVRHSRHLRTLITINCISYTFDSPLLWPTQLWHPTTVLMSAPPNRHLFSYLHSDQTGQPVFAASRSWVCTAPIAIWSPRCFRTCFPRAVSRRMKHTADWQHATPYPPHLSSGVHRGLIARAPISRILYQLAN